MKKQVTIDGQDSDWYEKATFILKDKKESHIPDNLFLYAEHIIENYLKKNPAVLYNKPYSKMQEKKTITKEKPKKKGLNTAQVINRFFDFSLIVCGITLIALIVIFYL